jgi:predicted aspartyl protease
MMTAATHATLLRTMSLEDLLTLLTIEAHKAHDGHYTILAFTNGYKVAFGTPDLDTGAGRSQVFSLPEYTTLQAAIIAALVTGQPCGEDSPLETDLQAERTRFMESIA